MNDAECVGSYRRPMAGRSGRHSETSRRTSVATLGRAPLTRVLRCAGLLAVAVVAANSEPAAATGERSPVTAMVSRAVPTRAEPGAAGHRRSGRFAPVARLRAGASVVPSNRSRWFEWPARGTPMYQRAARMARHGDPEARMFVGGESDINPFDAG